MNHDSFPQFVADIAKKSNVFSVQACTPCDSLLTPYYASNDFAPNVYGGGGDTNVTVAANPGCSWTATSSPVSPWLSVTQGTSGTGNGTVRITAAANTSDFPRQGFITIAGQVFSVVQDPSTALSIRNSSNRLQNQSSGVVARRID